MKSLMRFALVGLLALTGCTTLSKLDDAGVTQKQAYIARSGFVVAQKTATHYLNYCTANRAKNYPACSRTAQGTVVAAVRDGRVARDELRKYMAQCPATGTCARSAYVKVLSITATINGIAANH